MERQNNSNPRDNQQLGKDNKQNTIVLINCRGSEPDVGGHYRYSQTACVIRNPIPSHGNIGSDEKDNLVKRLWTSYMT